MKTQKKIKGFTLIEIMIAVAIVGILASIAVPAYQTRIIQSKLAPAYDFLQKARTYVEIYYDDNGEAGLSALRASNFEARMNLTKVVNTKLINDYWIAPYGGDDITIWFRTKADAPLPSFLQNKWPYYLAGNIDSGGYIQWECKSDYIPAGHVKYTPSKCR